MNEPSGSSDTVPNWAWVTMVAVSAASPPLSLPRTPGAPAENDPLVGA